MDAPTISVIIPVRNGGNVFRRCLAALQTSTLKPHEFFVVDDGSTDDTRILAQQAGATVLQTEVPGSGPAIGRNLAAAVATGDVLYFFDSDVEIQPDTLARIQTVFADDPTVTALFGSYDDQPGHPGFLSQYKNIFHHYVHQLGSEEASTFWSGCGAVRREAFLEHGGFSSRYDLPSIEDIELGYALKRSGHRIVLDKTLQVKHLKQWTLSNLIHSDIVARGIPWTRLILREGAFLNDLNLQTHNRISVVVVYLMFLCLVLEFWNPLAWAGVPLGAAVLLWLNRQVYSFMAQKRGWGFGLATIAPHWLYYAYNGVSFGMGSLMHIIERDPQPGRPPTSGREKRIFGLVMGAVLIAAVFLRFHELDVPVMTDVEAGQVEIARESIGDIAAHLLEPGAMPLGLWVTHIALRFGEQEFWLRVASAFASILMVALMYRFVGRILGRTGGVMSAVVLALGVFDIYLARQVSSYVFFGLLSLLSFHSLFRALKNNRYDAWIGYAINITVCLFTHTFAVFVLCAQLLIAVLYIWLPPALENKRSRLLNFAMAAGGALLVLAAAAVAVYFTEGGFDALAPNPDVPLADLWLDSLIGRVWLLIAISLAVIGAVLTLGRDKRFGWMMVVWAVLPVVLVMIYSALMRWPVLIPDLIPAYLAGVVLMSAAILPIVSVLAKGQRCWGWVAWL